MVMHHRIRAAFVRGSVLVVTATILGFVGIGSAQAHAFLDHSIPAVGSSVPTSPPVISIWYTQDVEPAFSKITVMNSSGQAVDLGNTHVVQGQANELQLGLKPLPPGTYLVRWHVISVDTHPTQGTFTFDVGK